MYCYTAFVQQDGKVRAISKTAKDWRTGWQKVFEELDPNSEPPFLCTEKKVKSHLRVLVSIHDKEAETEIVPHKHQANAHVSPAFAGVLNSFANASAFILPGGRHD
jgi:hypothetical protein